MLPYSIILTIFLLMNTQHSAVKIDQLADLQWEYRIILGTVESEAALKNALNALKADKEGIEERRIAYFLTDGQYYHTNYQDGLDEKIWQDVIQIMGKTDDQFALIGLDGGVKARYKTLDVSRIFSLIDTMPMRRQEMRRN